VLVNSDLSCKPKAGIVCREKDNGLVGEDDIGIISSKEKIWMIGISISRLGNVMAPAER